MPIGTGARATTLAMAVVAAVVTAVNPAAAATGDGSPTDANIRYFGRWDTRSASAYVPGWTGAYAVVGFTGTTVKLRQRNSVDLYTSVDGGALTSYRAVSGTVNLTPNRRATEGWLTTADTPDGTHPDDTGHQKIAARLAALLG
ncbi:hypothetical protein [Amycolatopsis vastitatis]|uniref:hypothetical protein n=1 Tax=Amycolatopsis vastitatis TaxID=1905142 RepID=UPI001F0A92C6|nr:hypothetical protein [Amycolatopsis vastitatis]